MHNAIRLSRRILIAAALLLGCMLLICAGRISHAGIQGSGLRAVITIGRITGFGSIFVDGVEYSTSRASIEVDGQPASDFQLQIGQIVSLQGGIGPDGRTGTAFAVSFSGDVRGLIQAIDRRAANFVVLGQTVHVDSATLFGDGILPASLSGLRAGQTVEVSGYRNAAGVLVATRIDLKDAQDGLQVRGTVQSLDPNRRTFHIQALTVDFSSAGGGEFAAGGIVTVRGSRLSGGVLVASSVQASSEPSGKEHEQGRLEGLITTFNSSQSFSIADQSVATNAATHFILHGATLGPDLGVKVRGTYDATGVLVASKVEAIRAVHD